MKIKFLKFVLSIFLLSSLALMGCQQEPSTKNVLNIPVPEDARIASNLQRWTNDNTPQGLEEFNGGTVENALDDIEEALNYEYGVPDQSIGQTRMVEDEFLINVNNGVIDENQAQLIYNNALNHWAETYEYFEGNDKQALVLGIDGIDNANGTLTVKVSAWVGEKQQEDSFEPCEGEFSDVNHVWANSQLATYNATHGITISADTEITKRLNVKLEPVGKCSYITKQVVYTHYIVSPSDIINKNEVNDVYCDILEILKDRLEDHPNLVLGAIEVVGQASPNGNGGTSKVFVIKITLGVRKLRLPCVFPVKPEKTYSTDN